MKNSLANALSSLASPPSAYSWPAGRRRVSCAGQVEARDARQLAARELIQRLPGPEQTITCIMASDFRMIDLGPLFIQLAKRPAIWCGLFTLGWNRDAIEILCDLKRRKQIRQGIVIGSHYFRNSDSKEFEAGRTVLERAKIRVVVARCHVKCLAMDFGNEKTVTAHGSANFRSCQSLENLCVSGSPEVFKLFHSLAQDITTNPKSYE